MKVTYKINQGQELDFHVPAQNQNMRWAAYSVSPFFCFWYVSEPHLWQCNGFSAGVNPDDFRGPGFQTGYDPLWVDLLAKHSVSPFHVLVGGGDQLYCDGFVRLSEFDSSLSRPPASRRNLSYKNGFQYQNVKLSWPTLHLRVFWKPLIAFTLIITVKAFEVVRLQGRTARCEHIHIYLFLHNLIAVDQCWTCVVSNVWGFYLGPSIILNHPDDHGK
jgi:hypothetical protein